MAAWRGPATDAPQGGQAEVLLHGELLNDAPALRDMGHATPGDVLDRAAEQFLTVEADGSGPGLTRPEMVRSKVVFPAPLAPRMAVMEPG